MNEKINVLGVNIDSFTAKEAMKETIAFLESEPVSVIDVVSVDALMQMNDLPELKEKMNEFDMILPGEKLILEAAEEPELFARKHAACSCRIHYWVMLSALLPATR